MKVLKYFILPGMFFIQTVYSQTKTDLLFEETRINLNSALSQNAHVLSRDDFNTSAQHYLKAREYWTRGENNLYIKSELEESIALLTIINEDVDRSSEFFSRALNLRQNAINKNASRYSIYYWEEAEELLLKTIEEYKERNYEDAAQLLPTVEDLYSRAESYAELINNLLFNWSPIKNANLYFAYLLSPQKYNEGLEEYFSAINMLIDGDEITSINNKISEAGIIFDQSTAIAKDYAKVHPSAILSREDARKADAEKFAAKEWFEAEDILQKSGREFEDKDYEEANKFAADAIQKYKISKIIAVKEKFLSTPRQKIELAKKNDADEYAPKTFDNAVTLYYKVESLIESENYIETEIESLSKQSEMEADKSSWITNIIKSVENGDATWEDIILNWNIWDSFNKQTGGYERKEFVKTVPDVKKTITNKFSKFTSDKLYLSRYQEIDMEMIESDGKILLRIYNINFRPAGWNLNEESKSILNQLLIVLEDLKGSQYELFSYTDDVGAKRTNTEISEARAKEISNYLIEHSSYLPGKLTFAGNGESNAIADNSNFEGRKKNNRIEILVSD